MAEGTRGALEPLKLNQTNQSRINYVAGLAPRAALLFLLAFLAYWPVFRGQFVWDDTLLVEKNPLVTHALNLRSVWFQTDFPLTVVAFWLQWLLWGKSAAGYHVINILLHAVNSVLV